MSWVRSIRDMSWLMERVNIIPETGCWEWRLTRNEHNYGKYGDSTGPKYVNRKAHRLAFELANGFLPKAVLHRCDNPPCCNPAHLMAGTQRDNVRDMVVKGRAPRATITQAQADEIRKALVAGAKGVDLALAYGVGQHVISFIRLGHCWKGRDGREAIPHARRACSRCSTPLPADAHFNRKLCRSCQEPRRRR